MPVMYIYRRSRSNSKSPTLCAAPYLRTMAATRVWQSLVRRGFAVANGHDAAQPYRFTGMFSLPEPMPAAGQGS